MNYTREKERSKQRALAFLQFMIITTVHESEKTMMPLLMMGMGARVDPSLVEILSQSRRNQEKKVKDRSWKLNKNTISDCGKALNAFQMIEMYKAKLIHNWEAVDKFRLNK